MSGLVWLPAERRFFNGCYVTITLWYPKNKNSHGGKTSPPKLKPSWILVQGCIRRWLTKGNHLEPPRKIDQADTSWSTLNKLFPARRTWNPRLPGEEHVEKKVLLAILKPSWPWAQVGVEDLGFRALGRGRALEGKSEGGSGRERGREWRERVRVSVREREIEWL